jgi:LPXTG-motif cell wall-anchored protein
MNCAVGIERSEEEEDIREIEVTPKGCVPVSEDMCKSGYKAFSKNITFPENALDSCCRCKEGETCKYCNDPSNCTEEERVLYVTNEDCFGEEEEEEERVVQTSVQSSESSPEITPEEKSFIEQNKWYILLGLLLLIGLAILIYRFR